MKRKERPEKSGKVSLYELVLFHGSPGLGEQVQSVLDTVIKGQSRLSAACLPSHSATPPRT